MDKKYDVTVALNYYSPYVSGVTEAARVIAEGLVQAGMRVLVVAGRHEDGLAEYEVINGVDVHRTTVVARIGKGIVSPGFVSTVVRAARRSKLLMMHMPMLESGVIAAAVRKVPIVGVYQCDVSLPTGMLNKLQEKGLDCSHRLAFRRCAKVVVSSDDYARHSRLWPSIHRREVVIPPPAVERAPGSPRFRLSKGLHVGFLGRIVAEKGLEYLVEGFKQVADPNARLLIAGDFAKVAGGSVVDSVRAAIGQDTRIVLLGFLPTDAIGDFYASIDVFALPSVNALEAFGLVQVEGMMSGVPALASDLPGVRQPVRRTGFGTIVPPRDADAIRQGLEFLSEASLDREQGANKTKEIYSEEIVVSQFVELVQDVSARSESRR